jgi:transcriptional regulator with XRE-family HTH domain
MWHFPERRLAESDKARFANSSIHGPLPVTYVKHRGISTINCTHAARSETLHVAQRFERLLDAYRRPDGSRWTGQQLDEATSGIVTRSYVTNLRKGRIENPGYEKMLAIASAMGFPPALWFEDALGDGIQAAPEEGQDLASRVGHLFETIRHPATGEPYTDADVARMSAGGLMEEEVEGMRTGTIPDPTMGQIAALAAVFGVPASYLVDRGKDPSILDEETLAALSDETASAIFRESARLSEREKRVVLGIVREFGGLRTG